MLAIIDDSHEWMTNDEMKNLIVQGRPEQVVAWVDRKVERKCQDEFLDSLYIRDRRPKSRGHGMAVWDNLP